MAEIVRELAYAADAVSARILLQRMRKMPFNRRRQSMFPGFLLAMLLLRAYVPVGFMPASGVPFALRLCPAGMEAMRLPHGHHDGGTQGHAEAQELAEPHGYPGTQRHAASHDHAGIHTDFESCPFGSAPVAGPISHQVDFESAGPAPSQRIVAFAAPHFSFRPQRSHQPRGPPSLA